MFYKKGCLKNFVCLFQCSSRIEACNSIEKDTVSFAKFLRTPILQNTRNGHPERSQVTVRLFFSKRMFLKMLQCLQENTRLQHRSFL